MEHNDLSSFLYGDHLDTPAARHLRSDLGGIGAIGASSPDAWSLFGRGMTPSVVGGGSAAGTSRGETNLFEISFGGTPGTSVKNAFLDSATWRRTPVTSAGVPAPSGLPWFATDDIALRTKWHVVGSSGTAMDLFDEDLTPSWSRHPSGGRKRALSSPSLRTPGGTIMDELRKEDAQKWRKLFSLPLDESAQPSSDPPVASSSPTATAIPTGPPSLIRRGTTSRTLTGGSTTTNTEGFSPLSQSVLETPPDNYLTDFPTFPHTLRTLQKGDGLSNPSESGKGNTWVQSGSVSSTSADREDGLASATVGASSPSSSGTKQQYFTLAQPPTSFRSSRSKPFPSSSSSTSPSELQSYAGGQSVSQVSTSKSTPFTPASPQLSTLLVLPSDSQDEENLPSRTPCAPQRDIKSEPKSPITLAIPTDAKSILEKGGATNYLLTAAAAAAATATAVKPSKSANKLPAKKASKKNGKQMECPTTTSAVDKDQTDQVKEEEVMMDEETKKKMFLERNRLAACKSRQKKKKRVSNLETVADDFAGRNDQLQEAALALQREVFALRGLLADHKGCSCEHVTGYLARECQGGGIPTIQALAGLTLELDYKNVPRMGSEDDVYGALGRNASQLACSENEQEAREASVDSSLSFTAIPSQTFRPMTM